MKASELFHVKTNRTGLYNIMPIENIPSVIKFGILSNNKAEKLLHASVAMQEIQDLRDCIKVPGGLDLHDYANLYFDPRNPMMFKRKDDADQLCVLKISIKILDKPDVIVADSNASSRYVRFYTPIEGIKMLDFNTVFMENWKDENQIVEWQQKASKCAEVLIPQSVPFNDVEAAFVVSEDSRNKLLSKGFDKPIAINGKIFFRR